MPESTQTFSINWDRFLSAQQEYHDCVSCARAGREHSIVQRADGVTGRDSSWGPGVPRTRRVCTTCGASDGPWIDAAGW